MVRSIQNLMLALLCCGPLLASSGYLRGVIVEVKSADGAVVSFVVLQDFEAHGRFGQKERLTIVTTANTAVTFDRQEALAADAIQVGRTAFVQIGRGKVVRVDVLDLPKQEILPEPAQIDPANGALELTLPVGKGPRDILGLTFTMRDGRVLSAVVKHGNAKGLGDAVGLKLVDGTLSGSLECNVPYAKRSTLTPKERKGQANPATLTFSASLGGAETVRVQADFWGQAREITAQARFRARRATPSEGRVVFHIKKDAGYFYDFTFEGEQVTSVARRHHYGREPKPVDAQVTFANGILSGSIEGIEVALAHIDMELHGIWTEGGETGVLTGGFVPVGQPLVTQDVIGSKK